MAETYSAGTIFLQVVPVFRHTQERVTAYAKGISRAMGDELEKGGSDAGDRFNDGFTNEVKKGGKKAADEHLTEFQKQYNKALADVEKSLKPINLKAESNDVRRQIREIKTEVESLSGKKIKIEADAREAENALRILQGHLAALEDDVKIQAKFDYRNAQAAIDRFVARIDSLKKDLEIEVRPDVDTKPAERAMGAFERKVRDSARRAADNLGDPISKRLKEIKAELEGVSKTDIHVGLNDDVAEAKLKALMAELEEISVNDVNIGVKVDAGRAFAELFAFKKFRDSLDGNTIHEKVEVDSKGAEASLFGLSAGGRNSANAFRAFNLVILAAVAILPALIPLVAALGGALLALGPILAGLGGGLAAVVIGFSGIANAVQALNQRANTAAKDTATQAKTIKSAWYSVVDARNAVADAERSFAQQAQDAARAVADARRSAAEATRNALEQQQQAQEAYAKSVQDVKDAEQALADARKQARQDRHSLKDQIKDNRLAIRQAVLGAFDATNNLNAVMADGSSTNYDKEQAKIQHAQALQSLHELRDQQKQLADEKRKQDKQGINGSDAVKSAQDQLTAAIQAQQDAVQNLGDASRAVDQARANGARQVADAIRNQHRVDADGRRSVARAQEQLRRAQEAYNEALKNTNDIGSAAQNNVRVAMAALGPAGREFARFIFSLRKPFYALRDDIQAVMLPPIERAIKRIINLYGPQIHDFLVTMGRGFGRFVTDLSKSLTGPVWTEFFKMLDTFGPKFARQFGKGVIQWLEVFARLLTITAPWALKLSKAMLGFAKGVNSWLQSKAGTKAVTDFMSYAASVGPTVVVFLENLVKAAINLAKALAPWGEQVLKALDGLLGWISKMDPTVLGLIATGILTLVVAFQVATGAVAIFAGVMALATSEIGVVAFAIALAIGALAILYGRFKIVRTIVNIVIKAFVLFVKYQIWLWKTMLQIELAIAKFIVRVLHLKEAWDAVWGFIKRVTPPILDAITRAWNWLADAAETAWKDYIQPALKAIGKAIGWLWSHVVKPILGFIVGAFRVLGKVIEKVWSGFIWPVLDLMIHIFTKLWQKVWWPILKGMFNTFRHLGDIVREVWRDFLKPVFDLFGKAVKWLWDKVLHPIFGWIGDRWHDLATGFQTVYNRFIKPVIDAFIDAMGGSNGLRDKFHTVVEAIKSMWEGLKKVFAAPIKFVLDTVLNHGLIAGFNKLAGFVGSKPMGLINIPKAIDNAYATGGVLPGYFPGGDNHHFTSPTGGQLHLSGGEAIMRPEWTQAVGSGFVNAMNAAARTQGARGVRKLLNGAAGHFFADGGIFGGTRFAKGGALRNPDQKVYMDGKPIAAIAAAQIMLAEQLRRTNYYLMQGGFGGDGVAASGTSHNFPGVADIGRSGGVGFADQTAMRRVGFAAWARNIAGAYAVGSGKHVHAVSMLSPGTASSGQIGDYKRGYNGLDSRPDIGPRPDWLPGLASKLSGFDLSNIDAGGSGHHGFGLPGWVIDIAKNPIGWAANLVTGPIKDMYSKFGESDFAHSIAGLPAHLVKGVAEKALDLIPGGHAIAKGAGFAIDKATGIAHAIGSGAEHVASGISNAGSAIGDVFGFARGGILPYNGTMMYDAGGYLPPGLTSVVNLTGKPEPVLTSDQFARVSDGKGGWTYAPTFNGSDLTAEDVMDDFEFTYRKLTRGTGRGPNGGTP